MTQPKSLHGYAAVINVCSAAFVLLALVACGAQRENPNAQAEHLGTQTSTDQSGVTASAAPAEATASMAAMGQLLPTRPLLQANCPVSINMEGDGRFGVLQDEASFRAALAQTAWIGQTDMHAAALPPVDFSQEVVVEIVGEIRGFCPAWAEDLYSISNLVEWGDSVEITVAVITGTCGPVNSIVTRPYAYLAVPRLNKPYDFLTETVLDPSCDD